MQLAKYHALGNDYLVLDPVEAPQPPTAAWVRRVCDRHFGLGGDGILYGPLDPTKLGPDAEGTVAGLRIFNPDGSEAEKSGNGLRIFTRYLFDTERLGPTEADLWTPGGRVAVSVEEAGRSVRVVMGRVSFQSREVPVAGDSREVLAERHTIGGEELVLSAATIGNPHCVIRDDDANPERTRRLGPLIETAGLFPQRTNVQFAHVVDRQTLRLEIWERGAGYTLASGSSSSAAAAVAHRLGWVDREVTVTMPGGDLRIALTDDYTVTMTGPVTHVGTMLLDAEALENLT